MESQLDPAVKVGKKPVAVIYKRLPQQGFFAVVNYESRDMTLLDAATFKIVKTISLALEMMIGQ